MVIVAIVYSYQGKYGITIIGGAKLKRGTVNHVRLESTVHAKGGKWWLHAKLTTTFDGQDHVTDVDIPFDHHHEQENQSYAINNLEASMAYGRGGYTNPGDQQFQLGNIQVLPM